MHSLTIYEELVNWIATRGKETVGEKKMFANFEKRLYLLVCEVGMCLIAFLYMDLCNFSYESVFVCEKERMKPMDFHHKSFLTLCHYYYHYYYHYTVIGLFTFILSCAGMCPKTYLTIYVMVKTTQSAFVRWYRHIWTSFNTTNDSKLPWRKVSKRRERKKNHAHNTRYNNQNTHTHTHRLKGDLFNVMSWISLASAFKV